MSISRLLVVLSLIFLTQVSFAFQEHPVLSPTVSQSEDFKNAMEQMSQHKYDVAEKVLLKIIDESEKEGNIIDILILKNHLAKSIMHQWRTDQALEIYQEMHHRARESNLDSLHAHAITALIAIYGFQDKAQLIPPLVNEGLGIKNIPYKEKSDLYTINAELYNNENKKDSALHYANLALQLDLSKSDSASMSTNYNLLGYIYSEMENKEEDALKNYFLSLCHQKSRRGHKNITVFSNIAAMMLKIRNIPKAKYYSEQALELATALNFTSNLAKIHSINAEIMEIDENYTAALEHIRISNEANAKPNKIATKINNTINKISCQIKLNFPINKSELEELIDYAKTSYNKYRNLRINYIDLHYRVINGINPKEFYKLFEPIKESAEKRKRLYVLKDLYQLEYKYLVNQKQYKEANQAILNYQSYVNEIFKERQEFVTLDLEAKYSKEKQDKQITLLAKDNILQEVRLEQQRNYLIGGAIGLLIISILLFFIFRLYRKLVSQNLKISKALSEKDFLLREIHHRVKNNLQVISSLLSLQSRQIKDEKIKKAINDGRSRVRSMALIHQNLYQNENLTGVSATTYMTKLVNELFDSYKVDQSQIALNLDIQEMELDVDTMVPLGLILNELVSNCLKHAFPDNRNGSITVSLSLESEILHLKVKDNGIGTTLKELQESDSFGNRLIKAFSQKLKADLEINDNDGTEVKMKIKKFKKVA